MDYTALCVVDSSWLQNVIRPSTCTYKRVYLKMKELLIYRQNIKNRFDLIKLYAHKSKWKVERYSYPDGRLHFTLPQRHWAKNRIRVKMK